MIFASSFCILILTRLSNLIERDNLSTDMLVCCVPVLRKKRPGGDDGGGGGGGGGTVDDDDDDRVTKTKRKEGPGWGYLNAQHACSMKIFRLCVSFILLALIPF